MDATASSETPSLNSIESFIRRFPSSSGSEIGNAQPFIRGLSTDALGVEPAAARIEANTYFFERRVTFKGGSERSASRIDCYKRGILF